MWLEFCDENKKEELFNSFDYMPIVDKDIDLKFKQIIRQDDKDIENETCKGYLFILNFIIDQNMIIGTIINSMLAYMSMFHFEEAQKCSDFLLNDILCDPEIYYRKA